MAVEAPLFGRARIPRWPAMQASASFSLMTNSLPRPDVIITHESDLDGLDCVAAIDLSGTRDLTALARVWEPDADGVVHAVVEFWTPEDTLVDRARTDQVPYDVWAREG